MSPFQSAILTTLNEAGPLPSTALCDLHKVHRAALYGRMQRLIARGCVEAVEPVIKAPGKPPKWYAITEKGSDWLAALGETL